jgi:hypothetical protein
VETSGETSQPEESLGRSYSMQYHHLDHNSFAIIMYPHCFRNIKKYAIQYIEIMQLLFAHGLDTKNA